MSGNMFEWCHDWYDIYQNESATDPTGVLIGTLRVIRGGGWGNHDIYCRSAYRVRNYPDFRYELLGFRVVRRTDGVVH